MNAFWSQVDEQGLDNAIGAGVNDVDAQFNFWSDTIGHRARVSGSAEHCWQYTVVIHCAPTRARHRGSRRSISLVRLMLLLELALILVFL